MLTRTEVHRKGEAGLIQFDQASGNRKELNKLKNN